MIGVSLIKANMRCHYIYDKDAGQVWIPGCWDGIHGPDGCTCSSTFATFPEFKKKLYNEKLAELNKENKELQKEVFRLNRIIKKLTNAARKA